MPWGWGGAAEAQVAGGSGGGDMRGHRDGNTCASSGPGGQRLDFSNTGLSCREFDVQLD